MSQQRTARDEVSFVWLLTVASVQFVLARFYQNVGEVVHEGYEAR